MRGLKLTTSLLEEIYARYNHRECVHPDPLEFLYPHEVPEEREIVALLASSLAYGRVSQILKSVAEVLAVVDSPVDFVTATPLKKMERRFAGFRHRFTGGDELAAFLFGMGRIVHKYGTLENCFSKGMKRTDTTVLAALSFFSQEIRAASGSRLQSLIPDAGKGSALKRLNLFLRWMVRRDDVDPGGWDDIHPSKLIVPLDTHLYSVALTHGLTERKTPDIQCALEVTRAFARHAPQDPVKYDFALTRPGIQRHGRG